MENMRKTIELHQKNTNTPETHEKHIIEKTHIRNKFLKKCRKNQKHIGNTLYTLLKKTRNTLETHQKTIETHEKNKRNNVEKLW